MSSDRKRVLYYPDRKQVVRYGERYGLYTEQGIVDFAIQAGWLLTIVSDDVGHLAPALKLVNASRYDGLITIIPESDSAIGKIMRSATLPTLNLFDSEGEVNLPEVLTDNHAIGRMGADHLMDQGIEHLAFIRTSEDRQTRERARGFRQQVESRGRTLFRLDPTVVGLSVLDRSADRERVPWLASQLLSLPRPLGVMIPSDTLYWHIIEASAAASLRIPEDVAVVSVGNIESLCKLSEPALTSVDPHYRRLGYEGAALLDRLMNGASTPTSPLLVPPGHVEIRGSTDCYAVDDKTLRAVLNFMRNNFRDPSLSVGDIVKASGTSRRNLYSIFEDHWPRSIADTLAEFRVQSAKRLLAMTDLKQYSIAVESGFSSEAQMSRAFSKQVGVTPGKFRLENRPVSEPASGDSALQERIETPR